MNYLTDEEFEEIVELFNQDMNDFQKLLDARRKQDIDRDKYILSQSSLGKKWKVVFRKASKKFDFPVFSQDSSKYDYWVNYYEEFIRLMTLEVDIEEYIENRRLIKEIEDKLLAMRAESDKQGADDVDAPNE